VLKRRRVAILEGPVGVAEPGFDIAVLRAGRQRFVAIVQTEVALGPDLGSARLQRLLRIEDEGKFLVINGNQQQGFLGHVTIDRGDGSDRLANESNRVVEGIAALLRDPFHLVVVLDTAGNRTRAPDDPAILVCEHRPDARQRLRFRDID
jgi:hypothetical protein